MTEDPGDINRGVAPGEGLWAPQGGGLADGVALDSRRAVSCRIDRSQHGRIINRFLGAEGQATGLGTDLDVAHRRELGDRLTNRGLAPTATHSLDQNSLVCIPMLLSGIFATIAYTPIGYISMNGFLGILPFQDSHREGSQCEMTFVP